MAVEPTMSVKMQQMKPTGALMGGSVLTLLGGGGRIGTGGSFRFPSALLLGPAASDMFIGK